MSFFGGGGVQLLYNVLVSTVQQGESAMQIHTYPLFLDFLPMPQSRFSFFIYYSHEIKALASWKRNYAAQ